MLSREPTDGPFGRRLRESATSGRLSPEEELQLFHQDRREHVEKLIEPALQGGEIVILDRYYFSTMAYQGYGHALGRAAVEALDTLVVGDLAPDLTIVIDVPVEVGLERADERPHRETRYERMAPAFHARVRAGFLEIARREPTRCMVVDGVRPVADVAAKIRSIVEARLMS